jgi:hypothetical protein
MASSSVEEHPHRNPDIGELTVREFEGSKGRGFRTESLSNRRRGRFQRAWKGGVTALLI